MFRWLHGPKIVFLDMDDESMNRYEKQLYSVFKTFDVDNEEALDRSAVHELCDALQLEDRGATLVNTLFERRSDRVTFAQFRNGLLAVLGGAGSDSSPVPATAPAAPPQPDPPPQHSDDDSSGREVAPKFVFGSKRYGRRSRPPRPITATDESPSPRSSSASRLDTDDKRARQRMRCRRSASVMEGRNELCVLDDGGGDAPSTEPFEHDRRIDKDEALALCRGLNMDGIDRRIVERIFDNSGSSDTTVGEFFDQLNASLTTTIEETSRDVRAPAASDVSACEPDEDDEAGCGVPSDLVLEAWERAGVAQPRRLLAELGFGAPALRPPELERALDDELRALPDQPQERRDARALLLAAALALSRLRLELARRRAELTTAERDKLRCDVTEANKRARLLAQEVDESHARIEAELKASVRRAETRQAEVARQAAAETAVERERAAATRARLELEVARRADTELRLRSDLEALRERADELETRASVAEERANEGERSSARLAGELRAALEQSALVAARNEDPSEQAALQELRAENKQLRDRIDELCAALEAAGRHAAPTLCDVTRGGDLSAELNSLLTQDQPEECDSSPASMDQRILSHVEAVTRLREIFESVNSMPLTEDKVCPSCEAVLAASRLLQERVRDLSEALLVAERPATPRAHSAAQTDADDESRRQQLIDAERRHDDEKQKLTCLVKELESSLEQMKAEYDKCEEYWSGKLEDERDVFIEEQRAGDERLADLVAKIADYERSFARAPALPAIDERRNLEAQFTDLDEEFARYRKDKDTELETCAQERERLQERVEALERRLAAADADAGPRRRARDYHNPAFAARPADADAPRDAPTPRSVAWGARAAAEVRELRARCGRAEAAVRRLHARLAAADVLVKDLYVENCQLAHRRPL